MKRKLTGKAKLGALTLYTACAMYAGDLLDIDHEVRLPLQERIAGMEYSDKSARLSEVSLETRVNQEGKREIYLRFDGKNRHATLINNEGYAPPPSILDRLGESISETSEKISKSREYGAVRSFMRDLGIVAEYYALQLRKALGGMK